jgi:hypothetical protein
MASPDGCHRSVWPRLGPEIVLRFSRGPLRDGRWTPSPMVGIACVAQHPTVALS